MLEEEDTRLNDKRNQEFTYIRLEDVVKSKGNPILKPRREDIGNYNQKLFNMQFTDKEDIIKIDMHCNPSFFSETADVSRIILCEPVFVSYFNEDKKIMIGSFMLIIHESDCQLCTPLETRKNFCLGN